jgi:hypothetical protein
MLDGKPLGVKVGRDLFYDTDPVIVQIQFDGKEYTVRETKQEIEKLIREV